MRAQIALANEQCDNGSCNFNISANTVSAGCNQQVTLTATCNGSNCDGVSYTWSGPNNFNAGSQSVNVTPTATNGGYTYTVTASRTGCSPNKTATSTVTVSGCGTPPPSGGGTCTPFGEVCSGNNQEIRTIPINVPTAGTYPLTITYKSHEGDKDGIVRAGGTNLNVRFNRTEPGAYATVTTAPVYLTPGATIGLGSGPAGGYICFKEICLGTGGSTPPPTNPPPPPPPNPTAGACTAFSEQCSGNNQEVRSVNINANSTGTFPLTLTYKSHERDVDGVVRANGVDQPVRFSKTQPGAYATVTTTAVPLNQGSGNVVEFRSQAVGGYLCVKEICVGSGGGTTPPLPPPPTGGGSCAGSINSVNFNWDGGNNSISFTVNSSAGNPQIKLSGPTGTDWLGTFDFGNSVWYQAVTGVATGSYTVSVRPAGDGGGRRGGLLTELQRSQSGSSAVSGRCQGGSQ